MTRERACARPPLPQLQAAKPSPLRPRDAASIMLLDRSGGNVRVLMGRRHGSHAFMPDLYVFPGGRCDPTDYRLEFSGDLQPAVLQALKRTEGRRPLSDSRARALALAAVRELHEEAGLGIGRTLDQPGASLPFLPDLTNLRYMARAITPPGQSRRFDTRFFAIFADEAEIDPSDILESRELQDLQWIDVKDCSSLRIPEITAIILADMRLSLEADPLLLRERPVPFYFTRHRRFARTLL